MTVANDWQPSCSLTTLRVRAAMLRAVREFFIERGYLEVETPCLSRDIVIDACLEPMELLHSGERWFLQTSPEAHMKRLLAAGTGSIFQISRVFRSGEIGQRHNPEFTMIEWYGVASTWEQQLELTELLVRTCLAAASDLIGLSSTGEMTEGPFARTSYEQAFQSCFDIDVHAATEQDLRAACRRQNIPLPENSETLQRDDVLNAMLAFAIEPALGRIAPEGQLSPEFLYDYPASQSALAITTNASPSVARRFELYINGIELCNGYQELIDAQELRRREAKQTSVRANTNLHSLPGADRLASAMEQGLPECSGVALGFDRLVMIAMHAKSISEVLAFSVERA